MKLGEGLRDFILLIHQILQRERKKEDSIVIFVFSKLAPKFKTQKIIQNLFFNNS